MDILSASIDLLNSTFPSEFIDLIDTRRQQHINIRRITSISAIVIIFSLCIFMHSNDIFLFISLQSHTNIQSTNETERKSKIVIPLQRNCLIFMVRFS